MDKQTFEQMLDRICNILTREAQQNVFAASSEFESRVREVVAADPATSQDAIDFDPHPQAFPDIAVGAFGIEVKFTTNDMWRSVANSVLETHRILDVEEIYVVFGKMGGAAEVKWGLYDDCVVHVRTSHVPRFEVELYPQQSLFERMGTTYREFRQLSMAEKMGHIRAYARGRLREGERLWWLEDSPEPGHTLPIQARLYTSLTGDEKRQYRAEAAILCPQIVQSGRSRNKYDDFVLYLMTYHGVLCHQARDLFSAGSVANPTNDDEGGVYIERALRLLERDMEIAVYGLEDALFSEYWGVAVDPDDRLDEWLNRADRFAAGWVPSQSLFLEYQARRAAATR